MTSIISPARAAGMIRPAPPGGAMRRMKRMAENLASAPGLPGVSAIGRAWGEALRSPRFRARLLLTAVALAVVMTMLSHVLGWVQSRPGIPLADPVLERFAPRDLTWFSFGLIYLGIITAIGTALAHPRQLVLGLQAYALLMSFRMVAMWLTPLGAPEGMILLHDPFAEHVVTGTRALTKDLFFSGHTSTLFLLYLAVPGRRVKAVLLVCTVLVGIALVLQHVHYAVDVFAGPFFAYGSFQLVRFLDARVGAP
jgi:membrane-associated phospholipid phosphatase